MDNQATKIKTKPVRIFKVGSCTASVFENEIKTMNGIVKIKSVNLRRTYFSKQGNFQNTNSFKTDDIPKAMLALRKAYEFIALEEKELQQDIE